MTTGRMYTSSSWRSQECHDGDCGNCHDQDCQCPHHFTVDQLDEWDDDEYERSAT